MSHWVQVLRNVGGRGQDAVLVTLASGKGSTPREAGAKMVVTPDALHGTIGGGEVEYQATDIARQMLSETDARRSKRYPLGADFGQYCGGVANLLFERIQAGSEWVQTLSEWLDSGHRSILVTLVADSDGDRRLLVRFGDSYGTLGLAACDVRAVEQARRMLAEPLSIATVVRIQTDVDALFEPVEPIDFNVVLFGAGHVGRALAKVLGALPVTVSWVDSRAREFPTMVPENVRVALIDAPLQEVSAARPGSWFLVMTHSHALDLDLVEAILRREDIAFCGMIGSATKRRTFEGALAKRGIGADALVRLTCPVGIPDLEGKDPGTIAVAIAAQLLMCRERSAANLRASRASGTSLIAAD